MSGRALKLTVSKLISPFSPGAIVDILGESFVTLKADRWPKRSLLPEIKSERLSQRLKVQCLYGPPMTHDPDDAHALGVTVARFPSWLFCQTCRRLTRWTRKDEAGATPACRQDGGRLVPMRFVVACRERSHGADVPWIEWLHRAAPDGAACRDGKHLRFRQVEGGSQGLSGLQVVCDTCNVRRTLGELRADVLKREGLTCRGLQPWQNVWGECGSSLEVLQRGATSFHYAETESAIDIPALATSARDVRDEIVTHSLFPGVRDGLDAAYADSLIQMLASEVRVDPATVRDIALAERDGAPDRSRVRGPILAEEFVAFREAANDAADETNFKTRAYAFSTQSGDPIEEQLAKVVESIILVDRLREVRAAVGFRRYRPDSELVPSVEKVEGEASWLPASEGFGEGIFLRLAPSTVQDWAGRAAVHERSAELGQNFAESRFGGRLHPFSTEYVALHSFAHALMRELSFSSGYSAASLRERVYCESPGDYGIFIYTTSSDEEGTLGGLVREGELDRIGTTLARAMEQISWCSNDPVCSESHPQNLDGLNLAACHACLLASETSCEGSNLLLDRVLLVGNETVSGLLSGVLDAVIQSNG